MNGISGINTRTIIVNRDNELAAMIRSGGRYSLVMNDPELVWMAEAQGIRAIYRESGDDSLPQDPIEFIKKRINHAPNAWAYHLFNEIDPSDEEQRKNREILKYVKTVGKRVVVGNYSTHRTEEQWRMARPLLSEFVTQGHIVGFHHYVPDDSTSGGLEWRSVKSSVGGLWIATEFAFGRYLPDGKIDPHRGWRGITDANSRKAFIKRWSAFYSTLNIGLLWFCYDFWDQPNIDIAKADGFGYNDYSDVIDSFEEYNKVYVIGDSSVVTYPPCSNPQKKLINHTHGLKLRDDPNLSGNFIVKMPYKASVIVCENPIVNADGYNWQRVEYNAKQGWAANFVDGNESFIDPANVEFKLNKPVGCDWITAHPFNEPRDYDGDGVKDDLHEGLDIVPSHPNCHPLILCCADGIVQEISSKGAYGNHVKIRHEIAGDVYISWYCHLDKILVVAGDSIKVGDYVGIMGSTGNSTGLHLHLSLQHIGHGLSGYVISDAVDPASYLKV